MTRQDVLSRRISALRVQALKLRARTSTSRQSMDSRSLQVLLINHVFSEDRVFIEAIGVLLGAVRGLSGSDESTLSPTNPFQSER